MNLSTVSMSKQIFGNTFIKSLYTKESTNACILYTVLYTSEYFYQYNIHLIFEQDIGMWFLLLYGNQLRRKTFLFSLSLFSYAEQFNSLARNLCNGFKIVEILIIPNNPKHKVAIDWIDDMSYLNFIFFCSFHSIVGI